MIRVGTVARGSEVAAARVLAATLARHHPDWTVTVLVLPGLRPALDPDNDPFTVLRPADLGRLDLEPRLPAAPPEAVAALMRPLLARHLLAAGDEPVLILPPDAQVHGTLDELVALLDAGEAVLAPRLAGRLPDDGERPDGTDLIAAGQLDEAIAGVRGAVGRRLVDWWADHAEERLEATVPAGNLLDAAPRVFEGIATLDDAGYGVSYWNLHERPLRREGDALTAGGRPLRLMRFAGFRADRPWWLSEAASRAIVLDDPVLSDLCGERAAALRDAGWAHETELARTLDGLAGDLLLDARLRRLHAEAVDAGESFGDLESREGTDGFVGWLTEPAPHGAAAGINRYAYDVWRERADVREAYPELEDDDDADGFVGWLWVHGRTELHLQRALLPPPPDWVDGAGLRRASVLVTGYLRGNLGLGEAARGYLTALQAAGVAVGTRSISADPPVERLPAGARRRPDERPFEEISLPDTGDPVVNLICVNADQLTELAAEVGVEELRSRYTIGVWGWETDLIPERWSTAFDLVDEVWVYSRYGAEHLARAGDVPVIVMPLPVVAPDTSAPLPFAVPDGFLFMFAFDFFSTLQRKNPLGLVEAFKLAFAPGEGPTLLLKTINADFRPQERERLRHAIGERTDVVMVDEAVTPAGLAALYGRADCYVSLHRAEGFGLTMAEAMSLGKPVVATGFSGNLDFMTPANSYLVDWAPTAVGPDAEHYPEDATWAEPSLEHAAAQLRAVWEDRDEAARRGARAAADVAATLSPAAIGSLARSRLSRVVGRSGRTIADDRPSGLPVDELEARVAFDLAGGGAGRGARGLARKTLFRALRPYSAREREVDEAVAQTLRRISTELEIERDARLRDRQRLSRLERRLGDVARGRE